MPTGNQVIPGDRSHLIGKWQGTPHDNSTFSIQFFENGTAVFSTYRGNFTVTNHRLAIHSIFDVSLTADFQFIGDYNTLALVNLKSTISLSFLGMPYGILLKRV